MIDLSLLALFQWIEDTAASGALRESQWVYPIVESVHVLSLAAFAGLTAIMDLRLAGFALRQVPVQQITRCLLPTIRWSFLVIASSGVVLFYATPVTFYGNVFFRAKFVLLVAAGLNAWIFHRTIERSVEEWGGEGLMPPPRARLAGLASLTLWTAVVLTGRMVAYNWFS